MTMIKQNDVIDVIYDSIYGYSLEEAFKILEDHRKGAYIPIEWIKNYAKRKASKGFTEIDCYWHFWEEDVLKMVADWEKENARD